MKPLWEPAPHQVEQANMTAFLHAVQEGVNPRVKNYPALYQWSVNHPRDFWATLWKYFEIESSHRWSRVLVDGDRMPGARWFIDARLNFAENLLRWRDHQPALVFWNEQGRQRRISYDRLFHAVADLAAALRKAGVGPQDRVAGFLPNLPEAVIAMLAAASVGAIWSSCSPDFGVQGVLDRFGQIQPKILFAADGYLYAGKRIDSKERLQNILQQIPSIEQAVLIPYLEPEFRPGMERVVSYQDFVGDTPADQIQFEQLPFDHPLYILYSSGTTGLPKCMVHGAGGTLIQHLKELGLHTDLKRKDRIFYFTTCGWMMWNWLVSSLAVGATVVLYDGSPFHPRPEILFDMAEQEEITVFGTSAKYLSLAEKYGLEPLRTHDLVMLRTILSTGSPLAPESFDYVYSRIKKDVCLSSISGGTDLISCFALGNPIGPVYRGEIQTRGLGMKVEIYNEQGQPVVGEPGELVCTAPFPSMPVAFWNDPEGKKYREAYFEYFPGVWRHGDWAELTPRGGLIIYGRSDATLNPGGVRIGTAEIYRQVETLEEVLESLAVGQRWKGDERVILFVRLREGVQLDTVLEEKIRQRIRENTTPRHVPSKILSVPDLPRTLSGKITELAVRQVIHGEEVKNTEALANPHALEYFRHLPELLAG